MYNLIVLTGIERYPSLILLLWRRPFKQKCGLKLKDQIALLTIENYWLSLIIFDYIWLSLIIDGRPFNRSAACNWKIRSLCICEKKTLWLLNMEDFKVNIKILQAGKSSFDCKRFKSRVCENTWWQKLQKLQTFCSRFEAEIDSL